MSARLGACAFLGLAAERWQRRRQALPGHRPPLLAFPSGSFIDCETENVSRSSAPPRHTWRLRRGDFIFKNSSKVRSEYAFVSDLGTGGFSKVIHATHRRTGIPRAVKKIGKEQTNAEEFEAEVRALISLDHPHIIKVLEYFEEEGYFYVITELCTGRSLIDYIMDSISRRGGRVPERDVAVILRQCLKAVMCCHTQGIVHRDLKPDNFMLTGHFNTIKLIDFGLSRQLSSGERCTEVVGSDSYMAPEMVLGAQHDSSVDVWSLGVVLFIMLAAEQLIPNADNSVLKDPSFVSRRLAESAGLAQASPAARDLLVKMLEPDPAKRIKTSEALRHPFIREYKDSFLAGRQPSSSILQLDGQFVEKMRRFADAPWLKKFAILAMVHISQTPPDAQHAVLTARLNFRRFENGGTGTVTAQRLKDGLEANGINIPPDFDTVFAACDSHSRGSLSYLEFVACILVDSTWPMAVLQEAFTLLDRSRDGVIDVRDLKILLKNSYNVQDGQSFSDIIREVDPSGKGYLNFDDFLEVMQMKECPACGASMGARTLSRPSKWRLVF
eukprot:TRINITY_DN82727_c0_g1_i1.p1 TRINITY_DN82727_c0_g1~~TRINITY_DN82727_c0_g1_i1.p1  ORF type:complete len:555 (-),score=78.56 TRINITY_DN82727_c0_g1_i1:130-1794(-)